MKKLLLLALLLIPFHSSAIVDLFELIEDTYGAEWAKKTNEVTEAVWTNLMSNSDFASALNKTRKSTPEYKKLQNDLRETVFLIETALEPQERLEEDIDEDEDEIPEEVLTVETLIDAAFGKEWKKKPLEVKDKVLEIAKNDEEFQELLKTNPEPKTANYGELIDQLQKILENVEFWFKSADTHDAIVERGNTNYKALPGFINAVTNFFYLKNFGQELVETFNQFKNERDMATAIIDSWLIEQHKILEKRLQGIQGIINEGNTCFQNAIYQVLKYAGLSSPMRLKITEGLEKSQQGTKIEDFFMTELFAPELFIKISRDYPQFKKQLNTIFPKGEQQDAEYLFDILSKEQKLQPNPIAKPLSKAFNIKKTYDYQCYTCGKEKTESETNYKIDLSLAPAGNNNLKSMIQNTFNKIDEYFCTNPNCPSIVNEKNQERTYLQTTQITPKGNFFLIQMPIRTKINIPIIDGIKMPEFAEVEIDETPFNIPRTLILDEKEGATEKSTWSLIGIVAHYGATLNGGHYISLVNKQGQWFKCDDEFTEPIPAPFNKKQELKVLSNEYGNIAKPYLLFYERIQ